MRKETLNYRRTPALLLSSLLMAAGLATTTATANELEGRAYVGPRIGVMDVDSDRRFVRDNVTYQYEQDFKSFTPGLEAGYRFNSPWEIRAYYDYLQADVSNFQRSSHGHTRGLDLLYNFSNNLYVGLGANNTKLNDTRNNMARATFGYRAAISEQFALRAEVAVQDRSSYTDTQISFGLNYLFGQPNKRRADPAPRQQAEPAPRQQAESTAQAAPVPVTDPALDSDGDGVPDIRDACPNTPRGYEVDERGCVLYADQTLTQRLKVTFDFDSDVVAPAYFSDIEELANFMRQHDELEVVIEGHSDLTGARWYNQQLSERRANAVATILTSRYGIAQSRVNTVGHGMSKPVVNEINPQANETNRRIEAVLSITKRLPVTTD